MTPQTGMKKVVGIEGATGHVTIKLYATESDANADTDTKYCKYICDTGYHYESGACKKDADVIN